MFFIDEYLHNVETIRDSIALTDQDGKRNFTYGQLDSQSNKIANKLVSLGVRAGDSVIIRLPRRIEYIACEIALLKIGAVIVPLIPEYPKERVEYIKKDCSAVLVIGESFLDGINGIEEFQDEVQEPVEIDDDGRAMIIYTSGSTGKPKGVVYTRGNIDAQIMRRMDCVKDISPLVFAASATMSFCVALTEYFRTLAMGGHIHILSNEVRSDAALLSSYYLNHQIAAGYISPRVLRHFKCKSDCLKRVFVGGEKVVNTYSADYEIEVGYGQSETVGLVTAFPIDKPYDNTPIGKPNEGIEIKIISSGGEEVTDGYEGEICLIGNLPCEYNNLEEQTKKVFQKLPDGRIFIRTGDIGKRLPDGNVLYLNRNDWMIKVHGQRVEPGEIEAVMNGVDGITGSVVKAFENEDGTMLLCGFYTESQAVGKDQIKKRLADALPDYMIPGVFVRMDAFPVNANGKTDRKSIERPDLSLLSAPYEKPVDETEEELCNLMQEFLHIKQVGRHDDFFELGGNSLNAVTLCARCSIEGIAPQIVMIGHTPAGIARLLAEKNFYPKPDLTVSKTVKEAYPLSESQKYQYEVCHKQGKTIDCIDLVYYFKLDDDVDICRLINAVESVVNEHVIYTSHIDLENGLLITDETAYRVETISLNDSDFEKFRKNKYNHVRNLKTEPLFEAKILLVDHTHYLFLQICHLVYDGKTLDNLLGAISARYNGEPVEAEQASIFDLIDYECRVRDDKKLIEKAGQVLSSNYEDLKAVKLFGDEKKYSTAVSTKILEKESGTEIDEFLKEHGISILTLFQAAAEMTISKMFQTDDFCYMNVYDGRGNQLLNASHGVFAKSVFMRSGVGKHESLGEYFSAIEKQYQKLVYYDILETFETVSNYPEIMSGITVNLRELQGFMLKLGEKRLFSGFLEEINDAYRPFTDFDLIINRYPKGYGYLVTVSSTKVSEGFAEGFIRSLEENVRRILGGCV